MRELRVVAAPVAQVGAEITGQTIGQIGAIPVAVIEQFSVADNALAVGVQ